MKVKQWVAVISAIPDEITLTPGSWSATLIDDNDHLYLFRSHTLSRADNHHFPLGLWRTFETPTIQLPGDFD